MKTISRHKTFIKDMRNFRLTDTQATKLWWIQLRSAILVIMRLLAMCQQKIPYEVF